MDKEAFVEEVAMEMDKLPRAPRYYIVAGYEDALRVILDGFELIRVGTFIELEACNKLYPAVEHLPEEVVGYPGSRVFDQGHPLYDYVGDAYVQGWYIAVLKTWIEVQAEAFKRV